MSEDAQSGTELAVPEVAMERFVSEVGEPSSPSAHLHPRFARVREDEAAGQAALMRINYHLDELGRDHPAVRALTAVLDGHRSRGTTGDAYGCDPNAPDHASCHLDGPYCDHQGCVSWPCDIVTTIDEQLSIEAGLAADIAGRQ